MLKRFLTKKYILITVGIIILFISFGGNKKTGVDNNKKINVITENITRKIFKENLEARGTVLSKDNLLISSKVMGNIENIFVNEGDFVEKGDKLFSIEHEKLEKNFNIKKVGFEVASLSVKEKEANMEKSENDFKKASKDFERAKKLIEKKAISEDQWELSKLKFDQSTVAKKHAQTLLDLSYEQKKQAEIAKLIAEEDLNDSFVYSPINGVVNKKLKNIGESCVPGTPVIKLVDTKNIEVSTILPAKYYNNIEEGKTKVFINDKEYLVTYKSKVIDTLFKSFEVKVTLSDDIPVGESIKLIFNIDEQEALAIPSKSIDKRNNKDTIFIVDNDKAKAIDINLIGNDNSFSYINNFDLENASIITEGQFLIKDGTLIKVITS